MTKTENYRNTLRQLPTGQWQDFLLAESGLPGPRGNLELAGVVAEEGTAELFENFLKWGPNEAPVNSPYEFLAFCGVVGYGRLLAEGQMERLAVIRSFAPDPRWRTREAVAMALQRWGRVDMPALLSEMQRWTEKSASDECSLWEHRAAVAGLCEPDLLRRPERVTATLQILKDVTFNLANASNRKSEAFVGLRKALAYCWSVAAAAYPTAGKAAMEAWFSSANPDVRWIMKENLKKNRLVRMDAAWVEHWQAVLNQ